MSGSKPRRARVRRARGSPGIGSSPRASPACLLSASIRSAPDPPTRPECRTSKAETAERRRASRRPPLLLRDTEVRGVVERPTNRSRGNARSYLPCRCTGTCCAPRTGARPTARRRATRKTCARWKTSAHPSASATRVDAGRLRGGRRFCRVRIRAGSRACDAASQTSLVFVREQRVRRRSLRSRRTRTALENNRRELGAVRVVVPRVRAARHLLASAGAFTALLKCVWSFMLWFSMSASGSPSTAPPAPSSASPAAAKARTPVLARRCSVAGFSGGRVRRRSRRRRRTRTRSRWRRRRARVSPGRSGSTRARRSRSRTTSTSLINTCQARAAGRV